MASPAAVTSSTAWYDSPLYYDMVYEDYTLRETRFLHAAVKKYGEGKVEKLKVLEPACGSGRLLESLAQKGHTVHGFDQNKNQINYAKNRLDKLGLKAKVWRDSLQSFKVPRQEKYDLVHCFVSTFKYILKEKEAVSALKRMAQSLRPEGLCLLGLHLTDYRNSRPDYEKWINRRKDVKVCSETWSAPARQVERKEAMRTRMTITEKGKTRIEETLWDFRTYSEAELRALLKQVPTLKLIACHDFHYNIKNERRLNDAYSDIILVLKKK